MSQTIISIEEMKAAQRKDPTSPETIALQRAYEAQRSEDRAAARLAARQQRAELDAAAAKRHETCEPRETAVVHGSCGQDVSPESFARAVGRMVNVTACYALVEGGELIGWTDGTDHQCRVIDCQCGAHWSNQPRGEAGYYVAYTIQLPPELRSWAKIELMP